MAEGGGGILQALPCPSSTLLLLPDSIADSAGFIVLKFRRQAGSRRIDTKVPVEMSGLR